MTGEWRNVSRNERCPICERSDWCSLSVDGTWVICRRVEVGGERREDASGAEYFLHRIGRDQPHRPVPMLPDTPTAERGAPALLDRAYRRLLDTLALSPEHARALRERGLDDETIRANQYRTLPLRGRAEFCRQVAETIADDELVQVPGFFVKDMDDGSRRLTLAGSPGLIIPVRDVHGGIVALKIRRDDDQAGDGRYLWLSSSSQGRGGPGPGTPVHVPLWDGSTSVVRVTEGPLKADVATALDQTLTIGVAGVGSWRPALDVLAEIKPTRVLLAFDADAATNDHVGRALEVTADGLAAEGYEVSIEQWAAAEGKGIDDALLVGAALSLVPVSEVVSTPAPDSPPSAEAQVEVAQHPTLAEVTPIGPDSDGLGHLYELPASAPRRAEVEGMEVSWPSLDRRALHGELGDFIEVLAPLTEADPVAILLDTLTTFGCWVGPTPHAVADGARHPAKLFSLIVGETAKARKGTSHARVMNVFADVDQDFIKKRFISGLGSGEALIAEVADATVDDDGNEVGRGAHDKRLLVFEPEFARLLSVASRSGSTLSPIVREAWDTGRLMNLTKNSPLRASDTHIAIVAHITKEELVSALSSVETANGFANRFLFAVVRRARLLPDNIDDETARVHLRAFGTTLRRRKEAAARITVIERDSEARDLWHDLYNRMHQDQPGGLLGAVTARSEAQVLRLSVVYALLDGSRLITRAHLEAAWAVWRYCYASAAYLFGDSEGDVIADQLLRALRKAGTEGLNYSDQGKLFSGHVERKRLDEVRARLEERGRIVTVSVATGGRARRISYLRTFAPEQREAS